MAVVLCHADDFIQHFSSLYTTVDGIFAARWVNTDALSAINITMPLIYLASALGMMFGGDRTAWVPHCSDQFPDGGLQYFCIRMVQRPE